MTSGSVMMETVSLISRGVMEMETVWMDLMKWIVQVEIPPVFVSPRSLKYDIQVPIVCYSCLSHVGLKCLISSVTRLVLMKMSSALLVYTSLHNYPKEILEMRLQISFFSVIEGNQK